MTQFQCWFCGKGIERADAAALMITVENFWRWHDEPQGDSDPVQSIYAHSECARICLIGANGCVDPGMFVEEE